MIVVFDTDKDSAAIQQLAEMIIAHTNAKDTREWVCETDMVKMVTGNQKDTLRAPKLKYYRDRIECKKEGRGWIYRTKSIQAYLNR